MADETSLGHTHPVVDDDPHFIINGNTKEITIAVEDIPVLIQHDHNSEQITLEVPKTIDGHDLTKCTNIEVNFINVDKSNLDNISASRYDVPLEDVKAKTDDPNTLVFHWLIDGSATKYIGTLNFAVQFKCIEPVEVTERVVNEDTGETEPINVIEDRITYRLNTKPFIGINVGEGIDTQLALSDQYVDIVDQWQNAIDAYGDSTETAIKIKQSEAFKAVDEKYSKTVERVTETVTNAKTALKTEIDDYAKEVIKETKTELVVESLNVEELLVQETGHASDKVMSQEATTKAIDDAYDDILHKQSDLLVATNSRVSAMEEEFKKIGDASVKLYDKPLIVDDRFAISSGKTYFVSCNASRVAAGYDYTIHYNVKLEGGLTEKRTLTDNITMSRSNTPGLFELYDEYAKYQRIKVLDKRVSVEFDWSAYVTFTGVDWDSLFAFIHVDQYPDGLPFGSNESKVVGLNTIHFDKIKGVVGSYTGGVKYDPDEHESSAYVYDSLGKIYSIYVTDPGETGLEPGRYALRRWTLDDGTVEYYVLKHKNYLIHTSLLLEINGIRTLFPVNTYTIASTCKTGNVDSNFNEYTDWGTITKRLYGGVSIRECSGTIVEVDDAYVMVNEDNPWENTKLSYTFNANGISSVTGPIKNGLKDTYTIIFDNGKTQTFEVNHGRSIVSIEKTGSENWEDTYEIRFNDGSDPLILPVPNVESNRNYLEENVEDIHGIFDKFGITTKEQVSEVTNLIDVPERTSKYAKLISFGGMSRKVVVPSAQGYNLLPFPYAGNNFGTDGAGTREHVGIGGMCHYITADEPWVVPENGYYMFAVFATDIGTPDMQIEYITIDDGVSHTVGYLTNPDSFIRDAGDCSCRFITYLHAGDIVTNFCYGNDSMTSSDTWTCKPAIYQGSYASAELDGDDPESYNYGGSLTGTTNPIEWQPRVAQYRFEHTKLEAIKSVGANLLRTPYSDNSFSANGLNFVVNSDGGVSISGTSSRTTNFNFRSGESMTLPAGTYTVSIAGNITTDNEIRLWLYKSSTAQQVAYISFPRDESVTFTLTEAVSFNIYIMIMGPATVSGTIKVMLNSGNVALPWESYSERVYTIPSDIPEADGFVADSGTVYQDFVDVKSNRYIPKVYTKVFTGNEEWKQNTNYSDTNVFSLYSQHVDENGNAVAMVTGVCNEYPTTTKTSEFGKVNGIYMAISASYIITDMECKTLNEFKLKLKSRYAEGNPVIAKCVLQKDIAYPTDLTTRLDKLIPVEPNGHLIAVTDTGEEVPLDVEFTVVAESLPGGGGGGADFSEALDRIIEIQNSLIGGA